MRISIRATLFGLAVIALPACEKDRAAEPCTACAEKAAAATVQVPAATSEPRQLSPWETVDDMFNGCAGGCGMRADGPTEGVVVQPGASVGEATYCLVSGVVFDVTDKSVKREVGGKTLYFCCEGCASYFSSHVAEISAMRGLTLS